MGVLSVNSNKKLINSLLKEIRLREDINLEYEIDQQIYERCVEEYSDTIDNNLNEMNIINKPRPRGRPRKIKVSRRENNNAKEKEK